VCGSPPWRGSQQAVRADRTKPAMGRWHLGVWRRHLDVSLPRKRESSLCMDPRLREDDSRLREDDTKLQPGHWRRGRNLRPFAEEEPTVRNALTVATHPRATVVRRRLESCAGRDAIHSHTGEPPGKPRGTEQRRPRLGRRLARERHAGGQVLDVPEAAGDPYRHRLIEERLDDEGAVVVFKRTHFCRAFEPDGPFGPEISPDDVRPATTANAFLCTQGRLAEQ
jgi:hypothetical protein